MFHLTKNSLTPALEKLARELANAKPILQAQEKAFTQTALNLTPWPWPRRNQRRTSPLIPPQHWTNPKPLFTSNSVTVSVSPFGAQARQAAEKAARATVEAMIKKCLR